MGKTSRDLKKWKQSSEGVGERIFAADGTAFGKKLQGKRQHGGFEELEEIQSVERLWEAGLERQVWGEVSGLLEQILGAGIDLGSNTYHTGAAN